MGADGNSWEFCMCRNFSSKPAFSRDNLSFSFVNKSTSWFDASTGLVMHHSASDESSPLATSSSSQLSSFSSALLSSVLLSSSAVVEYEASDATRDAIAAPRVSAIIAVAASVRISTNALRRTFAASQKSALTSQADTFAN